MTTRHQWRNLMRQAPDEEVRRPLWEFPPEAATAVIAERTARGYNPDPEPIGDPEYV
jgi:hypothetical protein